MISKLDIFIHLLCSAIVVVSAISLYKEISTKLSNERSEAKCISYLVEKGVSRNTIKVGNGTCWIMVRR